jgi:hypothetical protein
MFLFGLTGPSDSPYPPAHGRRPTVHPAGMLHRWLSSALVLTDWGCTWGREQPMLRARRGTVGRANPTRTVWVLGCPGLDGGAVLGASLASCERKAELERPLPCQRSPGDRRHLRRAGECAR